MKKDKKFSIIAIYITVICSCIGLLFFFLLPEKIAIQWTSNEPSNIVSKFYIFILPAISLISLIIGKSVFRHTIFRLFHKENEELVSYLNMCLDIILLTCEIYIIGFTYGLRLTISTIIILEVLIEIIIGRKILHKSHL